MLGIPDFARRCQRLATSQVPDLEVIVCRHGEEALTVSAPRSADNYRVVLKRRSERISRRGVPHPHRLVPTRRHDTSPIRTKAAPRYTIAVAQWLIADSLAGACIPQVCAVIEATGQKP